MFYGFTVQLSHMNVHDLELIYRKCNTLANISGILSITMRIVIQIMIINAKSNTLNFGIKHTNLFQVLSYMNYVMLKITEMCELNLCVFHSFDLVVVVSWV